MLADGPLLNAVKLEASAGCRHPRTPVSDDRCPMTCPKFLKNYVDKFGPTVLQCMCVSLCIFSYGGSLSGASFFYGKER